MAKLTLATYTGTHIDVPLQFLEGGKGVDELPLGTTGGDGSPLRAVLLEF
ncbi:MAG: hypothetical protein JSW32_02370 [Deltaproteobacteria bacterium]|nr:MAG: hypothetical protein JSW32_02370 [Deltaproteobacteria bacterium]